MEVIDSVKEILVSIIILERSRMIRHGSACIRVINLFLTYDLCKLDEAGFIVGLKGRTLDDNT